MTKPAKVRRPPRLRPVVLVLLATSLLTIWGPNTARADPLIPGPGSWPVPGKIVRGFDPPELRWLPGHRGVDLAASVGEVIRTAAAGRVAFTGRVGGKPVVVVSHGNVRTTYEPVTAWVRAGEQVIMGQPIGQLAAGGHCSPSCLHWGLLEGRTYLDPSLLISATSGPLRLLPESEAQAVARRAAAREHDVPDVGLIVSGGLVRPADGPITSPFGMRVDPIRGTWRLHSGTDFAAGCGTPIRAAAAGLVRSVGYQASYGNRLVIDHGMFRGRHLVTAYNHASGYRVSAGAHVAAGQTIGSIGSTGDSTGCHLHFMTYLDAHLTDPMSLLGHG